MFCPTQGLLFANTTCPGGGIAPPEGGRWIGHALVAFAGSSAQAYVNIAKQGQAVRGEFIALATPPPATPPLAVLPLTVWNKSTLTVAVLVNGVTVDSLGPGNTGLQLSSPDLPQLPWLVEVRSSSRELLSATINPGDVPSNFGDGAVGKLFGRVDLTCGRLDIWAGQRSEGPVLQPSGDCAP